MIKDEIHYMQVHRGVGLLHEKTLRLARSGSVSNLARDEEEFNALEHNIKWLQGLLRDYDARINGDRKGAWFPLYSGRRFWPQDVRPEDISIEEIAHSLARVNRFNGHTARAYSVAQHSCFVASLLPPKYELMGLLHDAAEAYIHDIISPIKKLLPSYAELEAGVMLAVCNKFGLDKSDVWGWRLVKQADEAALATEIRDLTPHQIHNGFLAEPPLALGIERCWNEEEAEERFLQAYDYATVGDHD